MTTKEEPHGGEQAKTTAEKWDQLKRVLHLWRQLAEHKLEEELRLMLTFTLRAALPAEAIHEHPLYVACAELEVDLAQSEWMLRTDAMPILREPASTLMALQQMVSQMEADDDDDLPPESAEERAEELFEEFWDTVKYRLGTPFPDEAVQDLATAQEEAKEIQEDVFCLWPLNDEGMTEGELVGSVMGEVADRTGLSTPELTDAQKKGMNFPVLPMAFSVQATNDIQQWADERAGYTRVLQWIRHFLPHIEVPKMPPD